MHLLKIKAKDRKDGFLGGLQGRDRDSVALQI